MFSYVLNEHLSKAVDFLKLNGSNSTSNKTNNNQNQYKTTSGSSNRTTDLNNNTVVQPLSITTTTTTQNSLLDEYDWFKPLNTDTSLSIDSYLVVDQVSVSASELHLQSKQNTPVEKLESSDDYHQQILLSLYHENLIKQYSVNSTSKKRRLAAQRKMTSYFNQLSINPDRLDEELKSFLEKNKSSIGNNNNNNNTSKRQNVTSSSTLYDEPSLADNSLLKPVRLFQKAYYKEKIRGEIVLVPSWRMKEKMKTISAALVMCLNIGVDPPDVVRPTNCSRMECWINTTSAQPSRSLELVGAELQRQYERWQPRARYKHCLDPTLEDVRKLCISLRKNAKDERVLFHYNGHGVPKPTSNGEIWVFNKEFTQYIPLSLYEVLTWMGSPSIYVWDCANSELVIQSFIQFEKDRETELIKNEMNMGSGAGGGVKIAGDHHQPTGLIPPQTTANSSLNQNIRIRDSIHLGACGSNESLPAHPDLPMDIFTACLTTPIKAALYWYVSHKKLAKLVPGLTLELLDRIPGTISDRRTMLGELNWIFTAITDTIAWNVLDSDLFQKLFRQDLLVASLFRNFLLAERIMKSLDCTPVSHPALPSTHEHPLWQAWDLALDMCITQLPHVVGNNGLTTKDFVSCGFFTEQIEIFDSWLKYNVSSSTPPEQLPIVLQILLSQQHRLKALELLAKFLDFGAWAVSAALSVGIFPYVLKLITTQPKELRPLLTFIWAKILAVDKSCQAELAKDNGHTYFIHVLSDPDVEPVYKIYSTFVLARLVDNYPTGKEFARQNHLISTCHGLLTDKQSRDYRSPLLRQWCCLCLGLCWQNYPEARWEGVRNNAHQNLIELIGDEVPEVRAAAIFALGTYIGCGPGNEADLEQTSKIDSEIVNAMIRKYDVVYLVRRELIVALYNYMSQFLTNTCNGAVPSTPSPGVESSDSATTLSSGIGTMSLSGQSMSKTASSASLNQLLTPGRVQSPPTPTVMNALASGGSLLSSNKSVNNLFSRVWLLLLDTQNDPYPSVADLARQVVAYFQGQVNQFDSVKQILVNQTVSQYRAKMINRVSSDLQHEIFPAVTSKPCHKLELNTEFTAWCSNYFLKPLLSNEKQQQSQQQRPSPTSQIDLFNSETLDHYCRLLYNYKRKKQPAKWLEPQTMNVSASFKHSSQIKHCKFHPYENQLCVADEECLITIYDLTNNTPQHHSGNDRKLSNTSINSNSNGAVITPAKLIQFANSTFNTKRPAHRITSMNLINVKHEPIVLTGTYDRVVRFWKPTDLHKSPSQSANNVNLITAFQAYSDSEKRESNFESGLIMEWEESTETLVCAGDTTFIRVWDMSKELYKDYPTQVASCVFSLSTSENYTVAGFGEGTVKVFDFRQPHSAGAALTTRTPKSMPSSSSSSSLASAAANFYSANVYKHESFVRRVHLHKPSNRLITAGASGDINIFDMRNMQNVLKESINNEPVFAVECHPINELVATANGVSQTVKIFDLKGKELSCVKYLDSFLGKRIPPINCLDWNMFKNELALGTQDSYVTLLSTK